MGPLSACKQTLASSEQMLKASLQPVQTATNWLSSKTITEINDEVENQILGEDLSCNFEDVSTPDHHLPLSTPSNQITPTGILPDSLLDMLGLQDVKLKDGSTLEKYLEECWGCDTKIQFSWQLKPLDLLGPISALLDEIEKAIDMFASHLDPFNVLDELCKLLNALEIICIPDLISMLLALKMLLKKYVLAAWDMKFDWTSILGPLIKLILDLICSLLSALVQLLVAPIDCLIGALETIAKLVDTVKDLANTAVAAAQTASDSALPGLTGPDVSASLGQKTITWDGADTENSTAYPKAPSFGGLSTTTQQSNPNTLGSNSGSLSLPTSIGFKTKDTFDENIKDPAFKFANPITKITLAIKDSKTFIQSLFANVMYSLNSLNSLFSNGISIQLKNLGAIIAILDLVSLVTMIIRMRAEMGNMKVSDWCERLAEDPNELADYLKITFPDAEIAIDSSRNILLREGPFKGVVPIPDCSEIKNPEIAEQMTVWIKELETRMSSK